MKELVIVTTWKRDELLYLTLEAIRRADPNIPIFVFSDRGWYSFDLASTCDEFEAVLTTRERHGYYGNTWNLLDACTWALKDKDPEIVHLIEDDTIINRKYFEWARQTLRVTPDLVSGKNLMYAAVCGRFRYPSHIENWYASPCASWSAHELKGCLNMVTPRYLYAEDRPEMQRALDEIFPQSKYKGGGAEQDGFYLRCIEHHGWRSRFPSVSMCVHAGWFGYNSPPLRQGPTGSFPERVQFCRDLLKDRKRRIDLFSQQVVDEEIRGEMQ